MKNCIITGGAGFLGMNLAKKLLENGFEVTVADPNYSEQNDHFGISKRIKVFRESFQDIEKVKKIIKGQDYLFHFAYSTLPSSPFENIENDIRDNVLSSLALFRAAADSGINKIIFPSSGGAVYGDPGVSPIKEDSPTDPICSYGITKLMVEKYLSLFAKETGPDYVVYRISNPYGPGQDPDGKQGLVAAVLGKLLRSREITVFGDGETVRDYLFIDDLTDIMVKALDKDLKNDVFNIGTGKGLSVNQIIAIAAEITGKKPEIKYVEKRQVDVSANILDISKISGRTGWGPSTDIKRGMGLTYEWLRKAIK